MLTVFSVLATGYPPPPPPFHFGTGYAAGIDNPISRRDSAMSSHPPPPEGDKQWESVHLCPKCGHALNLEQTDLEAVTSGIVTCPKCDWSSPINLKIVSEDKPQ